MNDDRRSELEDVVSYLEEARNRLDEIITDEQDSFDNLPEGLQCGRTGESMQTAIDTMESWGSEIDEICSVISAYATKKPIPVRSQKTIISEPSSSPQVSNKGIRIEDYSERSFAVYGDTMPFKEELKRIGGKYNSNLRGQRGWIFPMKKKPEVIALINSK